MHPSISTCISIFGHALENARRDARITATGHRTVYRIGSRPVYRAGARAGTRTGARYQTRCDCALTSSWWHEDGQWRHNTWPLVTARSLWRHSSGPKELKSVVFIQYLVHLKTDIFRCVSQKHNLYVQFYQLVKKMGKWSSPMTDLFKNTL